MAKEKEEKKKNDVGEYELVEVPVEMGMAIRTPSGDTITQGQLLIDIANNVHKILSKF